MASVVPEATSAGSLINVPPVPSPESEKLAVEYVPSSVRLAVCPAVSVTVNVPLVPVWVNVAFAPAPMSRRSIASLTPEGEEKPPIVPWKLWELSSISWP